MSTERPRPIRIALAGLTTIVTVALAVIPMLQLFDVITWSAEQTGAVQFVIGATSTALATFILAFATDFKPLTKAQDLLGIQPIEAIVTPNEDPMGNEGTPLVPIGDDGFEDGDDDEPHGDSPPF